MKNENSVLKNIRRYFVDLVGSNHIFVPMMLNFNIRSAIPRGDNHLLRYHCEDITVQTDDLNRYSTTTQIRLTE